MIGHNRAPAEFRLDIAPEQIDEARASIADIRGELPKPDTAETTRPEPLQRAEGCLRKHAQTVLAWVRSDAVLAQLGAATRDAVLVARDGHRQTRSRDCVLLKKENTY